MSLTKKNLSCKDVAPLLVFYLCDEVSAQERAHIDTHIASCSACAQDLAEEKKLHEALALGPHPADQLDFAGILLSQCRSELAEKLDDLAAPPIQHHWRPFGWLQRWMALRPIWAGAALVFAGLLLGAQLSPWFASRNDTNQNRQAMNVMAGPKITDEQLSKMAVAGINFSQAPGSASETVQVHMSAEQPLELSGNVDDPDVRRVLTYVLENGERSDPGVRLDCLDALRERARDLQVRHALMTAARKDQNPAVRMKALESLRDTAEEEAVRETLLDALQNDSNPGVRVEAVNLLVHSLEHARMDAPELSPELTGDTPVVLPPGGALSGDSSTDRVVHALEELQHRDPSRYVRLRSAAALRQIGPRELQ